MSTNRPDSKVLSSVIKIYLIGDSGIGKRSFIKRFNTWGCEQELDKNFPHELEKTISTIKYYTIKDVDFCVQVYSIQEAKTWKLDDSISFDDEDYDMKKNYKLDFKPTRKSISNCMSTKVIDTDNTSSKDTNIIHMFCFMFDESDFSTFDKLILYYKGLSKKFNLKQDYIKLLIGNKHEKQAILRKEENDKVNRFWQWESEFTLHQISTKLYFNFADFMSKIYVQVLQSIYGDMYNNMKDIWYGKLYQKQSFAKGIRNPQVVNTNPGPGQYTVSTKVYKNNVGPIFTNQCTKSKAGKDYFTLNSGNNFLKNSAELIIGNIVKGYSMGIKPGNWKLKSERVEKNTQKQNELRNCFIDENISNIDRTPPKSLIKSEKYFEESHSRKDWFNRESSGIRRLKREKMNDLFLDNITSIKTKRRKRNDDLNTKAIEHQYTEEGSKQLYLDIIYPKNAVNLEKAKNYFHKEQIQIPRAPGPNEYDIRGNMFSPEKGKSITGKKKYIETEVFKAPYTYLKGDLEKIAEHPKSGIIGYARRIYSSKDKQDKTEQSEWIKENYWELQRKKHIIAAETRSNSERKQRMEYFLEQESMRLNEHKNLMKSLEEERERNDRKIIEIYNSNKNNFKQNDEWLGNIKYTLVEESSPKYTMAGKYKQRLDNYNKYMKYFRVSKGTAKPMSDKINNWNEQELYGNINMNKVRPNSPTYSFKKGQRFKPLIKEAPGANDYLLFGNQKYALDDKEDFSVRQSYDLRDKRYQFGNMNGYPAPGDYKWSGFTEEIIKKTKNISEFNKSKHLEHWPTTNMNSVITQDHQLDLSNS